MPKSPMGSATPADTPKLNGLDAAAPWADAVDDTAARARAAAARRMRIRVNPLLRVWRRFAYDAGVVDVMVANNCGRNRLRMRPVADRS